MMTKFPSNPHRPQNHGILKSDAGTRDAYPPLKATSGLGGGTTNGRVSGFRQNGGPPILERLGLIGFRVKQQLASCK